MIVYIHIEKKSKFLINQVVQGCVWWWCYEIIKFVMFIVKYPLIEARDLNVPVENKLKTSFAVS